MMRSVSMLGRSMGTAVADRVVNASMTLPPDLFSSRLAARGERLSSNCGPLPRGGRGIQRPDVGESARDGGGRGHGRAHQMCARALALAPFEVPVGGRGHALACAGRVAVHPDAHGAAGLAPLEARRSEDLVEP